MGLDHWQQNIVILILRSRRSLALCLGPLKYLWRMVSASDGFFLITFNLDLSVASVILNYDMDVFPNRWKRPEVQCKYALLGLRRKALDVQWLL